MPVLQMRDVRFSWQADDVPILNVGEFCVNAGESVMISGPSGAGKSTLLSIVSGVALAQTGRVQVMGEDIAGMSSRVRDQFRADNLGIIFQQFNLVPYLSAIHNVLLPCKFSARRRKRIAKSGSSPSAEAARLLVQLDLQDPALIRRPAVELSFGQQQRVAAARALIGQPGLIIADEPTSALDESARDRFLELLFEQCVANDMALLFVSHDQRLTGRFDRSVSLSDISAVSSQPIQSSGNTQ